MNGIEPGVLNKVLVFPASISTILLWLDRMNDIEQSLSYQYFEQWQTTLLQILHLIDYQYSFSQYIFLHYLNNYTKPHLHHWLRTEQRDLSRKRKLHSPQVGYQLVGILHNCFPRFLVLLQMLVKMQVALSTVVGHVLCGIISFSSAWNAPHCL